MRLNLKLKYGMKKEKALEAITISPPVLAFRTLSRPFLSGVPGDIIFNACNNSLLIVRYPLLFITP